MIILDTDIMIDILREYKPAIEWLNLLGDEGIILPGFAIMELIQGCKNKDEMKELKKEIEKYKVIWPTLEVYEKALKIFTDYYISHKIGILDTIIGQMAVEFNLSLYTFNEKHYKAIPKLKTIEPHKK